MQETPESLSASDATVVLASNSLNLQELSDDGVTIKNPDTTYVEDLRFTLKAVDDAWFKIKDENNLETDSVFLLKGQEYKSKIKGVDGWKNFDDMFSFINESTNYVVLRNYMPFSKVRY